MINHKKLGVENRLIFPVSTESPRHWNHARNIPFTIPLCCRLFMTKLWIADHAEELHEHTVPKCFKFQLDKEGKAVMDYKYWSHD